MPHHRLPGLFGPAGIKSSQRMNSLTAALSLIEQSRYDEALSALAPLVDSPTTRREALGHRAFLCKGIGKYESAAADYEVLRRESPGDAAFAAYHAECLTRLGRYDGAIAAASEALRIDPRQALAARVIVHCHEALGMSERNPVYFNPDNRVAPYPVNPVIQKMESDSTSFPQSVVPEVGRALYTMVRLVRPKLMIETGTFVGYSAMCIAQAMEENGFGHLHSFDLFLDFERYASPVIGKVRDAHEIVTRHLNEAGLHHRVTLHKGDSSTGIKSVFGTTAGQVEMAFIDGGHLLKETLRDWQAVDAVLAEGGIVMLHDTFPDNCGWMGPGYLLEALDSLPGGRYHSINLPTPDLNGIAIIQKKWKDPSPELTVGLLDSLREMIYMQRHWPKDKAEAIGRR